MALMRRDTQEQFQRRESVLPLEHTRLMGGSDEKTDVIAWSLSPATQFVVGVI